jgi:flagellar motility protein MotE (MotC chaperone)
MKNAIIAGVVGLLFMGGGFYAGMQLMPKVAPKVAAVPAPTEVKLPGNAVPTPVPDAITLDTLKKTSESMMSLNQQLALREQRLAEREQKVRQHEDEITAERTALDASHEKFKQLFGEFKNRLQLVDDSEREQLTKQAELYDAMGPDQSIELIRSMDDATVGRLFSVMDTKPLAKLVTQWKTKYPEDGPRLLATLNATATVLPKEKIAISDPSLDSVPAETAPAPVAPSTPPPPSDPSTAPAPAPSAAVPDAAAPDGSLPPSPQQLTPPQDSPTTSKPSTADAMPVSAPVEAMAETSPAPAVRSMPVDLSSPGAAAEAAQINIAPVPSVAPTAPDDTSAATPSTQPVKVTSTNLD